MNFYFSFKVIIMRSLFITHLFCQTNCEDFTIPESNLIKHCTLNGYHIKNGTVQYLNISDNGACVLCQCNQGDVTCKHFIDKTSVVECKGEDKCNEYIRHPDVIKRCSVPSLTQCSNQRTAWEQNGCLWKCDNSVLSVTVKPSSWCNKLSIGYKCPTCPRDKRLFLDNNSDVVWACKSGYDIIWKYDICNGKKDCMDGSDEEGCKDYVCSPKVTIIGRRAEYFVPLRLPVGNNTLIPCENVSPMFIDGFMNTTCTKNYQFQFDYCKCLEKQLSISLDFTNYTLISREIKKMVSWIKNVEKVDRYLNITLQFLSFINSTNNVTKDETHLMINSIKEIPNISFGRICNNEVLSKNIKVFKTLLELVLTKYNITRKDDVGSFVASLSHVYQRSYEISKLVKKVRNDLTPSIKKEMKTYTTTMAPLMIIETVCSTISMVSLILGIGTLIKYRSSHSKIKLHLHINLMTIYTISLMIQLSLTHLFDSSSIKKVYCTSVVYMVYFTILGTYSWMTAQGINILSILLLASRNNKLLFLYYTVGYGMPTMILSILSLISYNSFYYSSDCLVIAGSLSLIKWPAGCLLLMNLLILIACSSILVYKQRISSKLRKSSLKLRSTIKSFFILAPLLGGSFLMSLFLDGAPTAVVYVHLIINGSMGFLIFICHVKEASIITSYIRDTTKLLCCETTQNDKKSSARSYKDDLKLDAVVNNENAI